MNIITVIGLGYKPLDQRAQDYLLKSDFILASPRLFEVFSYYEIYRAVKDKVKVLPYIDETFDFIRQKYKQHKIALLASGDPLFCGIGKRAIMEFGKEAVEIMPELSSLQVAFSRIKESWDDAFLVSLHGGPDPQKRRRLTYEVNDIPHLAASHRKVAILTDPQNNPVEIAKALNQSPLTASLPYTLYVAERLGYPDEKITEGSPKTIMQHEFSQPNVLIIKRNPEEKDGQDRGCRPAIYPAFGLTEDEFLHSGGLITKDEIRAVAIHKLRLPQKGIVWDIGAGSGSVSIEIARLCPDLLVFAIEKDEKQLLNLKGNVLRYNLMNVKIMAGEAPSVLDLLPPACRVFIGGSGNQLAKIIRIVAQKMNDGLMLINATTLETLHCAITSLEENQFSVEICQLSVARSKAVAAKRQLSALNPIFIITGERGLK